MRQLGWHAAVGALELCLRTGALARASDDADELLPGKLVLVRPGLLFKFISKPDTAFALPSAGNEPTVGGEAQLPFGGTKATGVGEREMAEEGLNFFTEIKTVFINYSGSAERSMTR